MRNRARGETATRARRNQGIRRPSSKMESPAKVEEDVYLCLDIRNMNYSAIINFRDEDQIISNISELTQVPVSEILDFLPKLINCPKGDNAANSYWEVFERRFRVYPKLDGTVYFHGCRILRAEADPFSDGLFPNRLCMDKVWETIWLATKEHLDFESSAEMRSDFEKSSSGGGSGGYDSRLNGKRKRELGPWGKLVRPEWFIPNLGSNHYIEEANEIVSIALKHFSKCIDLHKIYQEQTIGCLVHFILPEASTSEIGHGLSYLRDVRFCSHKTEFEGFYGLESAEGQIIPKSRILSIERI